MPPRKQLSEVLEEFALLDDIDLRSDLLIDYAKRFQEVPPEIAKRPFPAENLVPACQSEAYIWAKPLADNTLKFYFAVENPQGISAKSFAVILDETMSGLPPAEILKLSTDIVYQLFGRGIAMGKGQGLMGMIYLLQAFARQHVSPQGVLPV